MRIFLIRFSYFANCCEKAQLLSRLNASTYTRLLKQLLTSSFSFGDSYLFLFLLNCLGFFFLELSGHSNIGLTFKSAPELLRRLGVVFASSSRKNHDKGFIRLKRLLDLSLATLILHFFFIYILNNILSAACLRCDRKMLSVFTLGKNGLIFHRNQSNIGLTFKPGLSKAKALARFLRLLSQEA